MATSQKFEYFSLALPYQAPKSIAGDSFRQKLDARGLLVRSEQQPDGQPRDAADMLTDLRALDADVAHDGVGPWRRTPVQPDTQWHVVAGEPQQQPGQQQQHAHALGVAADSADATIGRLSKFLRGAESLPARTRVVYLAAHAIDSTEAARINEQQDRTPGALLGATWKWELAQEDRETILATLEDAAGTRPNELVVEPGALCAFRGGYISPSWVLHQICTAQDVNRGSTIVFLVDSCHSGSWIDFFAGEAAVQQLHDAGTRVVVQAACGRADATLSSGVFSSLLAQIQDSDFRARIGSGIVRPVVPAWFLEAALDPIKAARSLPKKVVPGLPDSWVNRVVATAMAAVLLLLLTSGVGGLLSAILGVACCIVPFTLLPSAADAPAGGRAWDQLADSASSPQDLVSRAQHFVQIEGAGGPWLFNTAESWKVATELYPHLTAAASTQIPSDLVNEVLRGLAVAVDPSSAGHQWRLVRYKLQRFGGANGNPRFAQSPMLLCGVQSGDAGKSGRGVEDFTFHVHFGGMKREGAVWPGSVAAARIVKLSGESETAEAAAGDKNRDNPLRDEVWSSKTLEKVRMSDAEDRLCQHLVELVTSICGPAGLGFHDPRAWRMTESRACMPPRQPALRSAVYQVGQESS